MKTFELAYTIEEASSWRSKEALKIKSNLADDRLIDCEIAQSLVEYLKKESAVLEPDKLLLSIAEAQKREIQTILDELSNIELQAKVNADKAHETLLNISTDAEKKYEELVDKFGDIQKRFTDKMKSTTESIKVDLAKLTDVEEALNKIDNWKLKELSLALEQINKLVAADPELVKLVLAHKNQTI